MNLRDLIIGRTIITSRSEYKRLILTGYLALICIVIAVIYATLDFINSVYYSFVAYAILLIAPVITLLLIRKKYYIHAKVILLVSISFVVFWAAVNDPFETGAFLFFIPAGIGPFAILTFENYKTAIALTCFTICLFLLAYFGDVQPIAIERPSVDYIITSFILNYLISLTVSVLTVYFLISLNKASEIELIQKETLAIQKNAELQKVNDELDRFVYSVSHDLRSPLSSILGLTNLARASDDRQEVEEILTMIQGRVQAQDNFIRDIINYARNARTEVAPEKVNLKQMVDGVLESLKYNPNVDKITFHIDIDESITLETDRIRLSIILSNLISNAIKYFDARKENPFIEISYLKRTHSIYIKDNGIGIMPEHQSKVFNMFYRGSDRSTGSGLGLFITKEAVNKMKATIDVDSVYGQGSTFTIRFPREQKVEQPNSLKGSRANPD